MKVYNTLSGRKEEFTPAGDPVKMYVCGVTPYSECHIGHAMSYIIFDVIRRYLESHGYRVKYVQNFTDVDDKIIARANEQGISTSELAERFIAQYFEDMDALNIKRADEYPYATGEIDKIIDVIDGLTKKGYAYEAEGSVYFRVARFDGYGKLSHRSLDDMTACEAGVGKEHPGDFTLWKAAKPEEPWWNSPWGRGRPGWHIECSVMSLKYLGETLDIHGGGQDLIFPHHENEIAQAEAFTGVAPFVKYWLHNGLLQLGEEKMSKSLGNLITVKEALERCSADAIRLFVLSSHYRSPLTYTEEGLTAAEKGVERLRLAAHRDLERLLLVEEGKGYPLAPTIDINNYRQRFIDAMDDDFNTAQALAALFDLAREINRLGEEGHSTAEARKTLVELAGILGLTLEEEEIHLDARPFFEMAVAYSIGIDQEAPQASHYIDLLIEKRAELRRVKEWALADTIRAGLAELSVILEDTPQGTVWKLNR